MPITQDQRTVLGLLVRKVWGLITGFFGLLLPLGTASTAGRLASWLRWPIHFLMVAAIVAGLWWLNDVWDLQRLLRAPIPVLRQFWLPLLFLLFYVLCWLGWALWQLLGIGEEPSEFPDVAAAWDEAVRALNDAGIALADTPLFLILGRPLGGEDALFQAARLTLSVHQVPRRPDAPLYVYANREGIYVTCTGASLLGRQAALLAEAMTASTVPAPAAPAEPQPEGMFGTMPATLGTTVGPVSPGSATELVTAVKPKTRRPRVDQWAEEADRLSARLRQIGRLIVRDRAPFCPINGILVLLPISATETDDDAQQIAALCRRDLAALRDSLQVRCPSFAVLCDLETDTGFRELRVRIPKELADRRFGREFPLAPDISPESLAGMIASGVEWLCRVLFPSAVFRVLQAETQGSNHERIAGNGRLHHLLNSMRQREIRLARLVAHGLAQQAGVPPLFGGCFLAGTGRDPHTEQAFLAGVFERLLESQNFVSWTDDASIEEADYNRWATLGYAAAVLALLIALPLGWFLWPDW